MHRFRNIGETQAIKHMGRQRVTTVQNLDIALWATQRQELGLDISLVTIGKGFRESELKHSVYSLRKTFKISTIWIKLFL